MRPFITCALPAVLLAASGSLSAQDTTTARPQTHTVVKGDNLWTLAQQYLGNPFLWPELYRLNRDIVEDPHWIYPGEILRLPGAEPVSPPPSVTRETPQQQAGQRPGAQAARPDTTPPVVAPPPAALGPEELPTTQFARVQAAGNASTQATITIGGDVGTYVAPTVRSGEALVAPFADREGGPRSFGRILKSADLAGIAQASERYRFQLYDRVLFEPPVGHVAPEGERYLAYRLGPIIERLGQVMIPTGIIEVQQAPRTNQPAVARVVKAFNELSAADRLIPLDTAGLGTTVRPRPVSDGPSTTVRWVQGDPVLPSLQAFVILAATSREGVRLGDQYLIYRPRPRASEDAPADPPVPVGKAQVVRVTAYGSTAVIVGQQQPAIQDGMPARVIARIP